MRLAELLLIKRKAKVENLLSGIVSFVESVAESLLESLIEASYKKHKNGKLPIALTLNLFRRERRGSVNISYILEIANRTSNTMDLVFNSKDCWIHENLDSFIENRERGDFKLKIDSNQSKQVYLDVHTDKKDAEIKIKNLSDGKYKKVHFIKNDNGIWNIKE